MPDQIFHHAVRVITKNKKIICVAKYAPFLGRAQQAVPLRWIYVINILFFLNLFRAIVISGQ